jgi:hypothetical protein
MFVGVCDVGASCLSPNTHRVEQSGLGGQACFDVAQAFPESQLGEEHAEELISCGEASAFSRHGIFGYATIKLLPVENICNLRKDKMTNIHIGQSQQGSNSAKPNSNA